MVVVMAAELAGDQYISREVPCTRTDLVIT